MPSSTILPTEVLAAIVDKVDHQETLFNALLCSRLYYRITLPFLYRHIRLIRRVNLITHQVVFPNAYDFACRVLRDPQLAAFVEAITFVPLHSTEDLPSSGAKLESLDSGIVRAIAHDWEGSDKHVEAFRKCRDSETILAILLPFLPRLREMHLITGDESGSVVKSACLRMMRRMAHTTIFGSPSTIFQHLKHVSVSSRCEGIHYEELLFLLGLSKLQKVSACNLCPTWWQEQRERAQTRFRKGSLSSVTDISYTSIHLSPQGIVGFLEPCRALKVLELAWYDSSVLGMAHTEAGWRLMNEALLSYVETLERITMTYTGATSYAAEEDMERFVPLEALSHLQKLRYLKLGMAFLFNPSEILVAEHPPWNSCSAEAGAVAGTLAMTLPQQIEELCFVCHEIEYLIVLLLNIKELLEAVAQGSFTKLRSIKVENVRLDLMPPSKVWDSRDVLCLNADAETRDLLLGLKHRSRELNIAFQWFIRWVIFEVH